MNEILGVKLVQLYSSYVNDITNMHVANLLHYLLVIGFI